jgi:predicted NACHT family NTPase
MLENVRKFWVEGVLENSLHDAAMIDLGMKPESGAVDNPWDTLIRTPSGEERMVDESIMQVFDRMNGKLLILGDPGSGKTTTLLTLARDLLVRAEADEAHPLPVVFNLSSWSENQPPLTEWLVEELNSKYQVPRKVAQKWMDDDELLLLLDGLDEVAETVRDACVEAINQYRSEHGFVDVVVCSRIVDYEALAGQLKLNGAIVIQPLDEDQIVTYLDALGADVAVVRELIARDVQFA